MKEVEEEKEEKKESICPFISICEEEVNWYDFESTCMTSDHYSCGAFKSMANVRIRPRFWLERIRRKEE